MSTQENIKKLQEALEKGIPEVPLAELAPTYLKVDAVDTSTWTEFPERFFKAPECKSTIMHVMADEEARDRDVACSFFSVVADTKEEAIARLRSDLLKVVGDPRVHLYGFLCRPSTINLLMPPKGKTATEVLVDAVVDLGGPKKFAEKQAAFCFLFAEITCALTPAICCSELGLESAVREGEVGKDIST